MMNWLKKYFKKEKYRKIKKKLIFDIVNVVSKNFRDYIFKNVNFDCFKKKTLFFKN